MKMSAFIISALLLAAIIGFAQPTNRNSANGGAAELTSAQATSVALRLANEKANALFHHRPFKDGQPARLLAGKWVWTDGCGVALLDYHASVTLAADGSTNRVDIQVWDDTMRPYFFRSQPGFPGPMRSVP